MHIMKTAIIGCGNIGSQVAAFIDQEHQKTFSLDYLIDTDEASLLALQKKLKNNSPQKASLEEAIEKAALIIECAHPRAAQAVLACGNLDKPGKKIIFLSSGGLIDETPKIDKLKYAKIYYPSGAISGLDAIRSVKGRITSLTITTTKSPKGLAGAPFIVKNNIVLSEDKRQEIFSGNLAEAVEGFPKNINVAATLFLASRFREIEIKIVSDPSFKLNTHEIEVNGEFGQIKTITQNKPSANPKTSQLVIYSVFEVINSLV